MALTQGLQTIFTFTANTGQATSAINQMGRVFGGMINEAEKGGRRTGSLLVGLGGQTTIAGSAIEGAFRGVTSQMMETIKVGMNFESQMATTMGSFADGVARSNDLMEAANDVGTRYALSNVEAAEALEVLGKAGRSTDQAISELEPVVKLAEANNLDLAKAAEIVAVTMTQFSKQGLEAADVSNILTASAFASTASVEEMGTTFNHAGAVAAALNVPFNEFAVILTALSANGIDAMKAGTAFRGILTRLISPTKEARQELDRLGISIYEQGEAGDASVLSMKNFNGALNDFKAAVPDEQATGMAIRAMETLGVSAYDSEGKVLSLNDMLGILKQQFIETSGNMDSAEFHKVADAFGELGINVVETTGTLKPVPEIIMDLAKATENMSEAQRNSVIQTLATQGGMQALSALIGVQPEKWAEYADAVNDGGAALDNMTELTRGTLAYALEELSGNIETLRSTIYEELVPALNASIKYFLDLVRRLREASPQVLRFVAVMGAIGAIIGGVVAPLVMIIGLLILAIQAMATALLPVLGIVVAVGLVFLALKDRIGELINAIQPAINAWKALMAEFRGGATSGEMSWLDRLIDLIGDVLIWAVGRAARAFQILVDSLITIRQVLNGTWESAEGIHPFTNAVGLITQKFVEWWPVVEMVATKVRDLVTALADSRVAQAVAKYSMFASLAVMLGGILLTLLGAVLAFGLAITKPFWLGPIKGIQLLNSALNTMGLGFKKASKEKDKHLKNQEKAQQVVKKSKTFIEDLNKTLTVTGKEFDESGKKADSFGTKLKNLYDKLANPPKLTDVGAIPQPQAIPMPPPGGLPQEQTITQKIVQAFSQTGINLLDKIKDAKSKTVTLTQNFVKTGTDLLDKIANATNKTITITQKFVEEGKDSLSGAGQTAGNKLAQATGSAFGGGIGAILARYAPAIGTAISGLLVAAAGLVSLPVAAIAVAVAALIGAIVFLIMNPQYLTMIGNALAWLFTTGIPYALGFIVGSLAELATQIITGLIQALGLVAAGAVYAVAGAFLLALSPLKLISMIVPPMLSGFLQLFNLVFVQLPILLGTLILSFWQTVGQIFFAGIQTLISLISVFFLDIPLGIITAFTTAFSTVGGQISTLITQVISGDWGGAIRTALDILKTIFISLPMEIGTVLINGFMSAFSLVGGYLSTVGSLIYGWLSGAITSIAQWGGEVLGVIGSTIGNIASAVLEFLSPLLNIGSMLVDGLQAAISGIGSVLSSIGEIIMTALNAIWEYIKTFASNFARGFSDAFGGDLIGRIGEAFSNAYDTISEAVSNVFNFIVDTLGALPGQVADFFIDMYEQVTEKVSNMADDVQEFVGTMIDGVIEFISNLYNDVTETFGNLVSEVITVVSGWASEVPGYASDAVTGFIGAFVSFVTDVVQFFIDVATGAATEIGNMVTSVTQGAVDIVAGFLAGFVTFVTDVMQFFLDLALSFTTWLGEQTLALTTGGKDVITGFLTGMQEIWTIVTGWIGGLPGQITTAIGDLSSLLTDIGRQVIQGFIDGAKAVWEETKGFFSGIGGWISDNKGPVEKDRVLLTPHGNAIIEGLFNGVAKALPGFYGLVHSIAPGVIGTMKQGFRISSPSQEMVDIAHALIDGLIVGMSEGQIDLAKKIADTVNTIIDAMADLIAFSSTVNATDILPINPDKLKQLTDAAMLVLNQFADALKGWSEEALEGLGKKLDPVGEGIGIFADMLGLLVDIGENASAFAVPLERFGDLKLALERALTELKLMFDAFGTDLVDGAVAGVRNATLVTDALAGIVEVLAELTDNRGVGNVNLDIFGHLKLAIERAMIEFDLMFQFLGPELIANATNALENATAVTDALAGIVEVMVALTENAEVGAVNADIFGQLKLAIERAMVELDLMFKYLGQDLLDNAAMAAQSVPAVMEALTSTIEFLSSLVELMGEARSYEDQLQQRAEQLAQDALTVVTAFAHAAQTWNTELTPEVESLATAVSDTMGPLTETIELLIALIENAKMLNISQATIVQLAQMLSTHAFSITSAFASVANTWSTMVTPSFDALAEAVETAMGALQSTLEFLTELVAVSPLTLLTSEEMSIIATQLAEYALLIADAIGTAAKTWDASINPAIKDFTEAAEQSLAVIAGVGDALEAILKFGSMKKQPDYERLASEMTRAIEVIVRAIREVSKNFEANAMKALGEFADNAGKAVSLVGDVAEAMTEMSEISKLSVKKVEIFKHNFELILDLIRELRYMAEDYLDDAIAFEEIAKHIAEALGNAAKAIQEVAGEAEKAVSKNPYPEGAGAGGGSGGGSGGGGGGVGGGGNYVPTNVFAELLGDSGNNAAIVQGMITHLHALEDAVDQVRRGVVLSAEAMAILDLNGDGVVNMTEEFLVIVGRIQLMTQALQDAGVMAETFAQKGSIGLQHFGGELSAMAQRALVDIEHSTAQAGQYLVPSANHVNQAVGQWHSAGQATMEAYNSGVRSMSNSVVQAATETVNTQYVANQIINGLSRGIEQGRSQVVNSVVGVVQSAIQSAEYTAGIRSPSREFMSIGQYMMEGLSKGILNNREDIRRAIIEIATLAMKTASDANLPEALAAMQNGSMLPNVDNSLLAAQMQSAAGAGFQPGYMNNTGNIIGSLNVGDININSVNDPDYDGQAAAAAVLEAIQAAMQTRKR